MDFVYYFSSGEDIFFKQFLLSKILEISFLQ